MGFMKASRKISPGWMSLSRSVVFNCSVFIHCLNLERFIVRVHIDNAGRYEKFIEPVIPAELLLRLPRHLPPPWA